MLGDFFRINLPYGLKRNDNGEWYAFNREYVPIGFYENGDRQQFKQMDLPIYVKYKGLTEALLNKLGSGGKVDLDDKGKVQQVWFYNDATNPIRDAKQWPGYFDKVKLLAKLKPVERI